VIPAAVGEGAGGAQGVNTITIGIGEYAISAQSDSLLVTHALGSCVAVCIWDPQARVAGLLHFLLPDASEHSTRSVTQPGAFASTGIPLLFETAYRSGLHKARARVYLIGGAEMPHLGVAPRQIGKRNTLAARRLLWANGVMIAREEVGGLVPRSVYLCSRTGRLRIKAGHQHIVIE